MSSETSKIMSELTTFELYDLNFIEIDLTLGLGGESRGRKSGGKRLFPETLDLNLNSNEDYSEVNQPGTECSDVTKPPSDKKNAVKSNFKRVKVVVDGVPYLRKVDLGSYEGYQQLQSALEGFIIRDKVLKEKLLNREEYFVTTYVDKDGDLMLVGDIPWRMFVERCKRIRLMRRSEEPNDIAPRSTASKCSTFTFDRRRAFW